VPLAPPLPPISLIESLLLGVGIDAVISRKVEKFNKARFRRAAKLPSDIARLSRKLVRGELEPSIPSGDFEWRQAVSELAAGWDPEQIIQMLNKFPPRYQAAASALVIKSMALIKELSAGLPLQKYQTFAGSANLIPADAHIFKFETVLAVIRDPLVVFPLMAGGALLKIQANAVRQTYPTISAVIDAAIFQATASAKAAKKSFELTERVEKGVRAWMGMAPTGPAALQQSQKNVAHMNMKRQNPAPPPSKPPQGLMTAGQRAESKAPATP
jgi:hypothetical protein